MIDRVFERSGGVDAGPRMARQRRGGFSLVELVVVLAVLALLMGLLMPSLHRAREASRRTVCVSQIKHLGAAIFSYANVNDDMGPPVMSKLGTTSPRTFISRPGKLVNLGMLLEDDLISAPMLYCPSQKEFNYPTDTQYLKTGNVACSYAYAIHIRPDESPRLGAVRHLALTSEDYVARLGTTWGMGRYSHRVGYNVLYSDGSALWYSDKDESIMKRAVHWDDETDDVTYYSLYSPTGEENDGDYGDELDIFRVWHSFCYSLPDPFGDPTDELEPE